MGTLKSFSQKTGFGFIACPELHEVFGADVFVHVKQMGPFSSVLMPGSGSSENCHVFLPDFFSVFVAAFENKPQAYDVQPMDGLLAESTIHNVSESMVDMSQMSQMATFPGAFTGLGGFQDPFTGFGHTEIPPKTAPAAAKRKWEDVTAELGRFRGVVKSFNGAKGFGGAGLAQCPVGGSLQGGGNAEAFVDKDPWTPDAGAGPPDGTGGGTGGLSGGGGASSASGGGKDNVLKMSNIVDQTDDSETKLPDAVMLNEWAQRYISVMGAPPQEEEEPTDAQLAALHHRVNVQNQPPYVDFSVWLPFGRRVLKNQKFRAFMPVGDGSFVMKELPGPQNLQQWLVSWRVFKAACISLNLVTLAALLLYEKVIEKLVLQWLRAWGLIVQADDKGRAEKLEKIRRSITLDIAAGGSPPREFTEADPWTACFRALALDERFWNEQELQAHGYTQDVFLSQAHTPATAQAGSNVSFTAFLNERSQPQAKNVELI
eukprot:g6118.t1